MQAQDGFEIERKRYEGYLRRTPLLMHARGREKLAATKDPRALDLLAKSYLKPEKPDDQVQYMIVSICCKNFDDEPFVDRLIEWRRKEKQPKDAWLWYRTLEIEGTHRPVDDLARLSCSKEPVFLRAAALEALARLRDTALLPLLPKLAGQLPAKEIDRAVIVESMASALLGLSLEKGSNEFREAAAAVIYRLDDPETLPRTRLVVARHLARLFDVDSCIIEARPWINLLNGETGETDDHGYARPRFFGVEASGDRICYVIDLSDSMLEPLKEEERKPSSATGAARNKEKMDLLRPDDLPWHLIKNRFDLAREHLKLSLGGLPPDKHFCVIAFGDSADLLDSCSGMIEASKANVEKVIRELNSIRPGSPIADRPHGTLRGKTNLHGGLHRAFKVKSSGFSGAYEYVTPQTFLEGCDTIFVLSDGDPTWDDWDQVDTNYGEDTVGDPETRTPMPSAENMHYHGPYQSWEFVIDDVRRMNLFRKVEIHCIGLGEVTASALRRLADLGLGRTQSFGRKR